VGDRRTPGHPERRHGQLRKSLWPDQWPLDQLKSKKANLDPRFWNAQYMQQPTADSSAIVGRSTVAHLARRRPAHVRVHHPVLGHGV
jgi:hypothetical protein